jgi:hypothetical protein
MGRDSNDNAKSDQMLSTMEFAQAKDGDKEIQKDNRGHDNDGIRPRSLIPSLAKKLSQNLFQVDWAIANCRTVIAFVKRHWPIPALEIWQNALNIMEILDLVDLLEWCRGDCKGIRPYPPNDGPLLGCHGEISNPYAKWAFQRCMGS